MIKINEERNYSIKKAYNNFIEEKRGMVSDSTIDFYWSPDSSKIAYQTSVFMGDNELYLVDAAGSSPIKLASKSMFISYDWHKVNDQLIYGTDKLYLYDADTAQTSVIKEIVDEDGITHLIGALDW